MVSFPWAEALRRAWISSSLSTLRPVRMASSVSFGVRKLASADLVRVEVADRGGGVEHGLDAVPLAEFERA